MIYDGEKERKGVFKGNFHESENPKFKLQYTPITSPFEELIPLRSTEILTWRLINVRKYNYYGVHVQYTNVEVLIISNTNLAYPMNATPFLICIIRVI